MVSVDLRRRLQDEKCAERADVCMHFTKLRTMREDLASMGHPPADEDFYAIILGSLPPTFDSYISAVNATSSVIGTSLSSDDLMQTVTEEYERRVMKLKGARKEENAAYTAGGSARGQGSSGGSKKNVECFNCHKKGHYKADCWAPGGGKEGQGPKGKGNAKAKGKEKEKDTAASAPSATHVDEAWMATADTNVLDFMEEGLNIAGLASDDKSVVSEESSIGASNYLLVDDFHTILAPPVVSHAIPPSTTFLIDNLFENYTSDDNWMLEDEFHDLPGLEAVSDSSDDEDLDFEDSEDEDSCDDEDSDFEKSTDDSDGDMPPLEAVMDDSESEDESVDVSSVAESDCDEEESLQPPHLRKTLPRV